MENEGEGEEDEGEKRFSSLDNIHSNYQSMLGTRAQHENKRNFSEKKREKKNSPSVLLGKSSNDKWTVKSFTRRKRKNHGDIIPFHSPPCAFLPPWCSKNNFQFSLISLTLFSDMAIIKKKFSIVANTRPRTTTTKGRNKTWRESEGKKPSYAAL